MDIGIVFSIFCPLIIGFISLNMLSNKFMVHKLIQYRRPIANYHHLPSYLSICSLFFSQYLFLLWFHCNFNNDNLDILFYISLSFILIIDCLLCGCLIYIKTHPSTNSSRFYYVFHQS